MRLALYELLAEPETPTGAIINEAVDLAKQYGSENSGKFVNGVLGTVATRINTGEITTRTLALNDSSDEPHVPG